MATKPGTRAGARDKGLSYLALIGRKTWKPLPQAIVLSGTADFFKKRVVDRFTEELFEGGTREVRRLQGPASERQVDELPLSTVLDELRTPSFFTPRRLILVERADAFVAAHGGDLLPHLEEGFGGGHLILWLDGKLDGRTKLAKNLPASAWVVDCAQPYDRPPPWEARRPVWDSDLTHWLVAHARDKGLELAPETAYSLHDRAGTDLGVLDEELEKIRTLLSTRGTNVIDDAVIHESVGDLREDSVFQAVELFLEGSRAEALEAAHRLFTRGYHQDNGAVLTEPTGIALLYLGALLPRLRALRRAHAMAAEGAGPDDWIAVGIVQKPFLARFQRELKAIPPRKLVKLIDRLYEVDRAIKTGGPAARLLELLIAELGGA